MRIQGRQGGDDKTMNCLWRKAANVSVLQFTDRTADSLMIDAIQ
jgi:hypothetical protein